MVLYFSSVCAEQSTVQIPVEAEVEVLNVKIKKGNNKGF